MGWDAEMTTITEPWVKKWRELTDIPGIDIMEAFNEYVESEDAAYQKAQRDMEAKAKKYMDNLRKGDE